VICWWWDACEPSSMMMSKGPWAAGKGLQVGAIALVAAGDMNPSAAEADEVGDVEAVNLGVGQVVRPHAQAGTSRLVQSSGVLGLGVDVDQPDLGDPQGSPRGR
jgi:hypothetical protein